MEKVIQQAINNLSNERYYMKHLEIISPFLPAHLTPKEIEVLGWFMSFEETGLLKRFDTLYRGVVRKELKLSHSGLSGHLSILKSKGAIKEDLAENLNINEYLFPNDGEQLYQFKIKRKNE